MKKNECLFKEENNINTLNGIINQLFSTRKRGKVVTNRPQKLQKQSGDDQTRSLDNYRETIIKMLDHELKIKSGPKRKTILKRVEQIKNDEESEQSEYIVLRF